eukprot:3503193-Lingulodinium_polyedra.AAC.1
MPAHPGGAPSPAGGISHRGRAPGGPHVRRPASPPRSRPPHEHAVPPGALPGRGVPGDGGTPPRRP